MMSQYQICHVPLATAGQLYVMARPDPQELQQVMAALAGLKVVRLVCLLPDTELTSLNLAQEPDSCARHGIEFVHFPIRDFGLPPPAAFNHLTRRLVDDLRQGRSLVIHCRAGIGRTGMLSGCVLRELGFDTEQAIALISQVRGFSIPDTPAQRQFIADYRPYKTAS